MLRDYQKDICSRTVEAFKNHRSVMVQMPTGTGKTIVLASLVHSVECGVISVEPGCARILIVAHRRELVEQIRETVKRLGIDDGNITVCSIQWLTYNIDKLKEVPSLVVIDEAHHALAKTYRMMWEKWHEARFLGLTATPYRMNGSGFTDLFDILICSLTMTEFMMKGVLATFDYISIRSDSRQQLLVDSLRKRGADGDYQVKEMNMVFNKRVNIGSIYRAFDEYAGKKKGIIYAISIEHAKEIADYYAENGIKAAAINSKTPAAERAEMIERFRDGKIQVLVNVDIFSEGFDCPDIEFIQLAKPTLSLSKYLQMVGRGLRPHKSKECCTIIDNVGLYRMFGMPTRHWDWQTFFRGEKRGGAQRKGRRIKGALYAKRNDSSAITRGEMEVVVEHGALEEMIRKSKLETYRDEHSGLWGLRWDGKTNAEATFIRVFDIKEEIAAVRMRDTSLAVVDNKGKLIRRIGKGVSMKIYNKDIVEVMFSNNHKVYIDIMNGMSYDYLPQIISTGFPEMIGSPGKMRVRLKDNFNYGYIADCGSPIRDYGYFMLVDSIGGVNIDTKIACHATYFGMICIMNGDDRKAYWLHDLYEDGSIDILDSHGKFYHVSGNGDMVALDKIMMIDRCRTIINDIDCHCRLSFPHNPTLANAQKWIYRDDKLKERICSKIEALYEKEGETNCNGMVRPYYRLAFKDKNK